MLGVRGSSVLAKYLSLIGGLFSFAVSAENSPLAWLFFRSFSVNFVLFVKLIENLLSFYRRKYKYYLWKNRITH